MPAEDHSNRAPIRIAIADDHALFRQGLRSVLELRGGVTVVDETDRADDVLPMISRSPCDILLLDLRMDRNSLDEIERLAPLPVRVVVVTSSEQPEETLAAIRAGARAVVFKRLAVETLMDAVHAVMRGDVWLPPTLQTVLADNLRGEPNAVLTPREREITRHVARGLRNSEVASQLFISEQTVKTHLNHIFEKLELRDRVELTLYAVRTGIVAAQERKR